MIDVKHIEELHRLKTEGIITEAEFEKAKADLLSGQAQPAPRPIAAASPKEPIGLPAEGDYLAWALLPIRRYADFTGRSTRKEFWLYLAAVNIILASFAIIALGDTDRYGDTGTLGSLMFGMIGLGMLGVLVPTIAVQVRRFHDQDKSGLLALINLIPYLGALVVLVFMAMEGTRGENRFGAEPRG